ncbi:MAG TPA: DNA methyltransferase [Candidatus Saccharimonadales bacterium]
MIKTLFVLGRQPIFGIAEIESLFPDNKISKINEKIISIDADIDPGLIDKLGGTVKIAREIVLTNNSNGKTLDDLISEHITDILISLPDGKINFGISYYGHNQTARNLEIVALKIKKIVKRNQRSIRIIPNKDLELSSAQVFHNKLTNKTNFELIVIEKNGFIAFARSTAVQNIDSYSSRDQKRPYRDAKVGMLPPKLAQIMINLLNPSRGTVILDPFCGTGVILQEALLMNLRVIGTDLDKRMVDYSTRNIEWLRQKTSNLQDCVISSGDATTNTWQKDIDYIVTEVYLGKPFFQTPSIGLINKEREAADDLMVKFLENIYRQINSGTKLCIAVPAWRYNNDFVHLTILDQIEKIGYNLMSFKNLDTKDLIYHRPDQAVARQILLLTRK